MSFPLVRLSTLDAQSLDAMIRGGAPAVGMLDAATSAGYAFLVGELEKRDMKVREPLTAVFWPRDIPVKTGGGWVDFTSTLNVGYATSGGADGGAVGSETNAIAMIQANLGKDVYPVRTWAHRLGIPFVDQAKLQQIGRSLDQILDKGIRLAYQKTLDQNGYLGFTDAGTTGLVNDPNVGHSSAAAGASGSTTWALKTPVEILDDINQAMAAGWKASGYDISGMPNQILIPVKQFNYLVETPVTTAGTQSILNYVLENNIGHNQGVELVIAPRPFCEGAGAGSTDRMVVYVNDEDRVNFDLPVPLSRIMTQPNVQTLSFETAYAGQYSVLKILYYEPISYVDGI